MPEHRFTYYNADGVKREMITDDEKPGQLRTYTSVQMDEVLESIKRAREDEADKGKPVNRHLARVPMTVMEQSIHEQWDESDWKRWLNDPANAAFRVWPGQV